MADRYTRFVLTVIAACLVWLCVNGLPQRVHADGAQPVLLAGWVDGQGQPWQLANGNHVSALPVRQPR
jgi:hypothetical protein